jgi:DNA-binding MarR family transcriptional regulator
MLSSAGITSRIDRLERRGFVRRLADPNDRRGVMVELTDDGLEAVDSAVAALPSAISSCWRARARRNRSAESILRKLLGGLETARLTASRSGRGIRNRVAT